MIVQLVISVGVTVSVIQFNMYHRELHLSYTIVLRYGYTNADRKYYVRTRLQTHTHTLSLSLSLSPSLPISI